MRRFSDVSNSSEISIQENFGQAFRQWIERSASAFTVSAGVLIVLLENPQVYLTSRE